MLFLYDQFNLPRRHPKPDESKSVNVAAQKARREKRARKRRAKSPSGRGRGFMTEEERSMIKDAIMVETRRSKEGAPDAEMKLRNLRNELKADDEAAKKKRSYAA